MREVLEGGAGHEGLEEVLLVEERVDEVGVVLDLRDETRVDDLQDHAQHLLQHGHVGDRLAQRGLLLQP